jgi:N-formylglutamate deformylase
VSATKIMTKITTMCATTTANDAPMVTLHRGTAPLLISLPHDGSEIPSALAERMTPRARSAPDTDWFVSRLYAFARDLGASMLMPRYSRYVVDLNRPPDDTPLYPGQNTTGVCPIVQFSGEPLYLTGAEPDAAEVIARVETYWQPYHAALNQELARLRAQHGRVLLWEGHSIRGEVPFLFEGGLPDLNLGTVSGASCSAAVQARIEAALGAQTDYGWVANGRFKGGYITRHYGRPDAGIDAVQLEIAQRIYMDETTPAWSDDLAAQASHAIRRLIVAAMSA